jgi:alpha-tubulin suppressor-like RCC1 family protein
MDQVDPGVVISQQPLARVISGSSATFSVMAASVPEGLPLTYQWYRLPKGRGSFVSVDGATGSTLSLTELSREVNDGDFYRCRVRVNEGRSRNLYGFSSAAVSLHFTGSPLLEGGVFSCGMNNDYSLGDGTTSNRSWLVRTLDGTFSSISLGLNHGFAIRSDGRLFGWGRRSHYVGTGQWNVVVSAPTVLGSDFWVGVAAGAGHSLAIKADGSLWGWGLGLAEEINLNGPGDGRAPYGNSPVLIDSESWIKVSAGGGGGSLGYWGHSMAIKADGSLWGWGDNSYGQLGLGDNSNRSLPTRVGPVGWTWTDVSAGYLYTLARRSDGTIWGWGQSESDDVLNVLNSPVMVSSDAWNSISAGASGSVGIKQNGTLWVTRPGVYFSTNSYDWVQVGNNEDRWEKASAGWSSYYAIRQDGTLWSWGENIYGQLSNGYLTEMCVPNSSGIDCVLEIDEPKMVDGGNYWRHVDGGSFGFIACS